LLRNLDQWVCFTFLLIVGASLVLARHAFAQISEVEKLQKDSLKKVETHLDDKSFQALVADLEAKASCASESLSLKTTSKQESSCSFKGQFENQVESSSDFNFSSSFEEENKSEGRFYIFVSFSMGEKALENLAHEAGRYGATLVLRGFKDGSYRKTAQALQKIITITGQGFIIDPELYSLFAITAVPTFVLTKPFSLTTIERTQTPLHDRLQGHVSAQYTLETFVNAGDLKEVAKAFLQKGSTK